MENETRPKLDFSKAKRGTFLSTENKSRITIRLDTDVLEWYKNQVTGTNGGSYQRLINQALRKEMESMESPNEASNVKVILRRLSKLEEVVERAVG